MKMPKFVKKIIFSILTALILWFSFVPRVHAQESWYNQDFKDWYLKVYDKTNPQEIFGERYTAAQVQWVIYGFFSFVLNATTGDPETTSCLMNNDLLDCVDRLTNFFRVGLPSSSLVAPLAKADKEGPISFLLKDRPLSGITYVKNILRKYTQIPEAKAQSPGFGFNALDPILPIWKASRNVAYSIFVLTVLALSFMIMFRVKISPQVVIAAQSALPKVIIASLLVTFSYAIAGFLIDLMYVSFGLISLFMQQVFVGLESPAVPMVADLFGFLTQGFGGVGIFGVLGLYWVLFLFISIFTLVGVNGLGGAVLAAATGVWAVLSLIGIVLTIILAFLLLFIGMKIIWMLLKAFVSVILLVIIGPLQIALGIVAPDIGFGTWLRSLISSLSVFPVTAFLISLSYLFLTMAALSTFEQLRAPIGDFFRGIGFAIPGIQIIMAATTHQGWPPLLIFGVQNPFGILYLGISVVILFVLPKSADIIKAMIERKPFMFGTAIGEAVTGPYRMVMGMPGVKAAQEYQGLVTGAHLLNWFSAKTGLFKESAALMRSRVEQARMPAAERSGTAPEK